MKCQTQQGREAPFYIKMKNVCNLLIVSIIGLLIGSCSSTSKLDKARNRQAKVKLEEYRRGGWRVTGTSRSLEVAVLEHFDKLENSDNREYEATVSMCRSLNVCKSNALNNVILEYAQQAGSYVRGRIVSDMFNNSSAEVPEEFDRFYAAYERLVSAEIKGELQNSYAVERDNGSGRSYKAYYIVNEEEASRARLRAMQRAFEESRLARKYAKEVSEFVQEAFDDWTEALVLHDDTTVKRHEVVSDAKP